METSLKFEEQTLDQTSDIWSLGCTILQFLLDTDTWNIVNFMKQFGVIDKYLALQKVWITFVYLEPNRRNIFIYPDLTILYITVSLFLSFRQWKYTNSLQYLKKQVVQIQKSIFL